MELVAELLIIIMVIRWNEVVEGQNAFKYMAKAG